MTINTWTRRIIRPGIIELTAGKKATGESDVMICDSEYRTLEWNYADTVRDIRLRGKRIGGAVRISGTVRGGAVDRTVPLQTAAWYQFAEFSLGRMVAARRNEAVYSLFWPDKMSFYVMKAAVTGDETISIDGKEIDAVRVRVTLAGFRSLFWSSFFWFRKPDYLFVKYRGVNGLPGTAETVIELVNIASSY